MHPHRSLPPGQQLAAPGKWPLVGEREPATDPRPWTLTIAGCVSQPRTWTLAEVTALPAVTREIDIHCVTRWSLVGASFTGVELATLLAAVQPTRDAQFLSFVARSPRDHSTSLPLADALQLGTLVAWSYQGQALSVAHGGPLRTVVPDRYFYKSLKWLTRIDVLSEERLGHWEGAAGYHNRADPWLEERFIASGITRQQAAQILEQRDLAGKTFLGLDGSQRDLAGLRATGAILRNASFARSQLQGARFAGANLVNADFRGSDLREVDFQGADLEGARFLGADLRGADLRGASLFGALFAPPDEAADPGESSAACLCDGGTRFDAAARETLTPRQVSHLDPWLPRTASATDGACS